MLHFLSGNISADGNLPVTASSVPPAWRTYLSPPRSLTFSSSQLPNKPSAAAASSSPSSSSSSSSSSSHESDRARLSLDAYERLVGMEFIGSRAAALSSANVSANNTAEHGAVIYFFTLLIASCNGKETSINAVRCSFSEGRVGDAAEHFSKDADDAHLFSSLFSEEMSSNGETGDGFWMNEYPDLLLEHLWGRFCAQHAPDREAPRPAAHPLLSSSSSSSSSSCVVLDRTRLFFYEGVIDIVHASLAKCEEDADVMNRGAAEESAQAEPALSSTRTSMNDRAADGMLLSFTERVRAITAVRAMPECGRKSRRTFASLRRFIERERNREHQDSHECDKTNECGLESFSPHRYFVWVHAVGTNVFYEATVTELVSAPHDAFFNGELTPPMRRRNISSDRVENNEFTRADGENELARTSIGREADEESESSAHAQPRPARAATLSPGAAAAAAVATETESDRFGTRESSCAAQTLEFSTPQRTRTTRLSGSHGTQPVGDSVMVPANAFCQSGYFLRSANSSQSGHSREQKNEGFTFYWLFACDYSRHGLQVKQLSFIPDKRNSSIGSNTKNDNTSVHTCNLNHSLSSSSNHQTKTSTSAASPTSHSVHNDSLFLQSGKLDVRSAAEWTLAQYPQWHHWDPVTQRLSFWAAFPTFDKLRIVAFDGHPDRRRCEFERNLTRRRRYMPDPLAGITHAVPLARGYGVDAEPFLAKTNHYGSSDSLLQGLAGNANVNVSGYSNVGSGNCGHSLNEAWGTAGASTLSRQHMCLLSVRYEDGITDLILCEQFFATPTMHAMRLAEGSVEQEPSGGALPAFFNAHATSNATSAPSDFSVVSTAPATAGLEPNTEPDIRVPQVCSFETIAPMASSHKLQHSCFQRDPANHRYHSTSTLHDAEGNSPGDGHHLSFSQNVSPAPHAHASSAPPLLCPPAIMCTVTALRNYADALQVTIPLFPEERQRITYNTRVCFLALDGLIAVYLPGVCVHYIDVHHKDVPPQYLFGVRLSSPSPTSFSAPIAPLVVSLPTPNGHWLYVPGTTMLFEASLRPASVWQYIARRLARRRACRVMACGAPRKMREGMCDLTGGLDKNSHTQGDNVEKVVLLHPALYTEAMDPAPLQHALHVALTHSPILAEVREEEGKHHVHRTRHSTVESSSSTTSTTSTDATSSHWSSSITPLLLEWETIWSKRDAQLESVFRSFFIPSALWQELTVEFISALVMAEAYERTRAICHWRPSLSFMRSRQLDSGSATEWSYLGNPFFAALPLWDLDGLLAEDRRFRRETARYYATWSKHAAIHERASLQLGKEEEDDGDEDEEEDKGEEVKDAKYKTTPHDGVESAQSASFVNESDAANQGIPKTNETRRLVPMAASQHFLQYQQQHEALFGSSDVSLDASLRDSLPNSLLAATVHSYMSWYFPLSAEYVNDPKQTQKQQHRRPHQQGGTSVRRARESERRSALLSAFLVRTTSHRDASVSRQQCHNTVPEWWLFRGVPPYVFSPSSFTPPHARLLFTLPSAFPGSTQGDKSSLLHKIKEVFRFSDKGSAERGGGRNKGVVTSSNNNNSDRSTNDNSQKRGGDYKTDWSNGKCSNATSAFSTTPVARMTVPLVADLSSSSLSTTTTTIVGGGNAGQGSASPGKGKSPARESVAEDRFSEGSSHFNSTVWYARLNANKTSVLPKEFTPETLGCADATVHSCKPQQSVFGKRQERNTHHFSPSDKAADASFDGPSCGTVFVKSVLDQLHRICLTASHSSSGLSQQQSNRRQNKQQPSSSAESFVSPNSSSLSRFLSPVSVSSVVSWVMSPADVRKSAAAQLAMLALMYDAAMASVVNLLVRVANTKSFAADAENDASNTSGVGSTTWSALDRWNFLQSLVLALNRIGVPHSRELATSLSRYALAEISAPLLLSAPRSCGAMADIPMLFRQSSSLRSEVIRHILSFVPHAPPSLVLPDDTQESPLLKNNLLSPSDELARAEAFSHSLQMSSSTFLDSTTGSSGYCDAHSPILSLHGAGFSPEFTERMQLCRLVSHAAPAPSHTTAALHEWKWHLTAALDPGPFLQSGDERSLPQDTAFDLSFLPFQLWWEQRRRKEALQAKADATSAPMPSPSLSLSLLEELQKQQAMAVKEGEEMEGENGEEDVCIPQLLAETSLGHVLARERAVAAMAVVLDPFFKND